MDRIYIHQRHIYDATRKFYLLGRDTLIARLDPPADARVLEIGCGTGRNLIKIARRYPDVRCYGVDISSAMLSTARRSVERTGLGSRIHMAEADATSFDPRLLFGVSTFDRVVVSYALSMIPPWREVLAQAAELVAPNGALHVIDFGDQAGLPSVFKQALETWLAAFHVTPRETLAAEFARIAEEKGFIATVKTLFRGYALSAEMSRTPAPVS